MASYDYPQEYPEGAWLTSEQAELDAAEGEYERYLADREAAHESYLDSLVGGTY